MFILFLIRFIALCFKKIFYIFFKSFLKSVEKKRSGGFGLVYF